MRQLAIALATLIAQTAACPAWADDAGLLRCRDLGDAGRRLACFDALAAGVGARPIPSPATGAAPAAAEATPNSEFGRSAAPAEEVKFIESQISGRFQGWNPEQLIELANGQVWRIADGSRAFFEASNPKVRIERGSFSAFYMVIAGTNQSPRVRRVK